MGFSHLFTNYIKILYQNNISMIINNGFLSTSIHLQRGLRQGCSLSLILYMVQGEVTTANVNKDQTIQGIKIPNRKTDIKTIHQSLQFLPSESGIGKKCTRIL